MLSVAAGQTITSAMYTVLGVRATTSADLPASGGKNSKARVSMISTATLRGYVDVYYDRLDLRQLANYSPILNVAAAGTALSALLTQIRDTYGINFTMADLAAANTVDDGSGTGACNLTLTALSTSIGWINAVTIKFAALPNISTAFYTNILPGF
ncbi:MAG: hypothetical protein P4L77_10750 [Sulfuriferula sp.]|nr:hypothetical protein [Sulfuriferula sp.]